jgi:arsenical pump membrane protein
LTAYGIGGVTVALIVASALDIQLGLPTLGCGIVTAAAVLILSRKSPWPLTRGVSWSVLPLVAGLFVMVEALIRSGVIAQFSDILHAAVEQSVPGAAWSTGVVTAVVDNIANNLPVGLIAGSVVGSDHLPRQVVGAMLIGVDLGPNLSVTGSLATILWLVALRREKVEISVWRFLWLGLLVMPLALCAALAATIR